MPIRSPIGYIVGLWLCPDSALTLVLGLPTWIFVATACHELGHFFVYRLLKLQCKRMVIFCFVWEQGKGFSVDRERKLLSASCTCLYDPYVPYRHYCASLLSGGFICLFLSILAFWGYCLLGVSSFLGFGIVCAGNALFNLLFPYSTDRLLLKTIKKERENTA